MIQLGITNYNHGCGGSEYLDSSLILKTDSDEDDEDDERLMMRSTVDSMLVAF